jgi:hypothetical protein
MDETQAMPAPADAPAEPGPTAARIDDPTPAELGSTFGDDTAMMHLDLDLDAASASAPRWASGDPLILGDELQ